MSFGNMDVNCDTCRDYIRFHPSFSNAELAAGAVLHGWLVKGDRAICPACRKGNGDNAASKFMKQLRRPTPTSNTGSLE